MSSNPSLPAVECMAASDGEFLAWFPNLAIAAKSLKMNESRISYVCTGQRRTTANLTFSYVYDCRRPIVSEEEQKRRVQAIFRVMQGRSPYPKPSGDDADKKTPEPSERPTSEPTGNSKSTKKSTSSSKDSQLQAKIPTLLANFESNSATGSKDLCLSSSKNDDGFIPSTPKLLVAIGPSDAQYQVMYQEFLCDVRRIILQPGAIVRAKVHIPDNVYDVNSASTNAPDSRSSHPIFRQVCVLDRCTATSRSCLASENDEDADLYLVYDGNQLLKITSDQFVLQIEDRILELLSTQRHDLTFLKDYLQQEVKKALQLSWTRDEVQLYLNALSSCAPVSASGHVDLAKMHRQVPAFRRREYRELLDFYYHHRCLSRYHYVRQLMDAEAAAFTASTRLTNNSFRLGPFPVQEKYAQILPALTRQKTRILNLYHASSTLRREEIQQLATSDKLSLLQQAGLWIPRQSSDHSTEEEEDMNALDNDSVTSVGSNGFQQEQRNQSLAQRRTRRNVGSRATASAVGEEEGEEEKISESSDLHSVDDNSVTLPQPVPTSRSKPSSKPTASRGSAKEEVKIDDESDISSVSDDEVPFGAWVQQKIKKRVSLETNAADTTAEDGVAEEDKQPASSTANKKQLEHSTKVKYLTERQKASNKSYQICRPIAQLHQYTNQMVRLFKSLNTACRFLGVKSATSLRLALRNSGRSYAGYYWQDYDGPEIDFTDEPDDFYEMDKVTNFTWRPRPLPVHISRHTVASNAASSASRVQDLESSDQSDNDSEADQSQQSEDANVTNRHNLPQHKGFDVYADDSIGVHARAASVRECRIMYRGQVVSPVQVLHWTERTSQTDLLAYHRFVAAKLPAGDRSRGVISTPHQRSSSRRSSRQYASTVLSASSAPTLSVEDASSLPERKWSYHYQLLKLISTTRFNAMDKDLYALIYEALLQKFVGQWKALVRKRAYEVLDKLYAENHVADQTVTNDEREGEDGIVYSPVVTAEGHAALLQLEVREKKQTELLANFQPRFSSKSALYAVSMASALDREEDSADEAEGSEAIVAPVNVPVVVDVDEEDAEEELEEVHEVVDEEDQIDSNSNDVILPPHVLASLPVLWMTRYALDDMLVTLFQLARFEDSIPLTGLRFFFSQFQDCPGEWTILDRTPHLQILRAAADYAVSQGRLEKDTEVSNGAYRLSPNCPLVPRVQEMETQREVILDEDRLDIAFLLTSMVDHIARQHFMTQQQLPPHQRQTQASVPKPTATFQDTTSLTSRHLKDKQLKDLVHQRSRSDKKDSSQVQFTAETSHVKTEASGTHERSASSSSSVMARELPTSGVKSSNMMSSSQDPRQGDDNQSNKKTIKRKRSASVDSNSSADSRRSSTSSLKSISSTDLPLPVPVRTNTATGNVVTDNNQRTPMLSTSVHLRNALSTEKDADREVVTGTEMQIDRLDEIVQLPKKASTNTSARVGANKKPMILSSNPFAVTVESTKETVEVAVSATHNKRKKARHSKQTPVSMGIIDAAPSTDSMPTTIGVHGEAVVLKEEKDAEGKYEEEKESVEVQLPQQPSLSTQKQAAAAHLRRQLLLSPSIVRHEPGASTDTATASTMSGIPMDPIAIITQHGLLLQQQRQQERQQMPRHKQQQQTSQQQHPQQLPQQQHQQNKMKTKTPVKRTPKEIAAAALAAIVAADRLLAIPSTVPPSSNKTLEAPFEGNSGGLQAVQQQDQQEEEEEDSEDIESTQGKAASITNHNDNSNGSSGIRNKGVRNQSLKSPLDNSSIVLRDAIIRKSSGPVCDSLHALFSPPAPSTFSSSLITGTSKGASSNTSSQEVSRGQNSVPAAASDAIGGDMNTSTSTIANANTTNAKRVKMKAIQPDPQAIAAAQHHPVVDSKDRRSSSSGSNRLALAKKDTTKGQLHPLPPEDEAEDNVDDVTVKPSSTTTSAAITIARSHKRDSAHTTHTNTSATDSTNTDTSNDTVEDDSAVESDRKRKLSKQLRKEMHKQLKKRRRMQAEASRAPLDEDRGDQSREDTAEDEPGDALPAPSLQSHRHDSLRQDPQRPDGDDQPLTPSQRRAEKKHKKKMKMKMEQRIEEKTTSNAEDTRDAPDHVDSHPKKHKNHHKRNSTTDDDDDDRTDPKSGFSPEDAGNSQEQTFL